MEEQEITNEKLKAILEDGARDSDIKVKGEVVKIQTPEQREAVNKLLKEFEKPKKIALVGDANVGKSNLLYYLIQELQEKNYFSLYTFGLKIEVGGVKINSLEELEQIRNSVIIIDEFYSLFDLQDRKKRKLIERTLRLIFHNNNVLVLCGLPENFKKYIAGVMDLYIFQKLTISGFINGSRIKEICLNYSGDELGSSILNLDKDEAIIYNKHYKKINIPYLPDYDTKKGNIPIICDKNSAINVRKKVEK